MALDDPDRTLQAGRSALPHLGVHLPGNLLLASLHVSPMSLSPADYIHAANLCVSHSASRLVPCFVPFEKLLTARKHRSPHDCPAKHNPSSSHAYRRRFVLASRTPCSFRRAGMRLTLALALALTRPKRSAQCAICATARPDVPISEEQDECFRHLLCAS